MKSRPVDEYIHVDEMDWQPFPQEFSTGGIKWKLLHVSPEVGAWTAIFECPKNSSFASHVHLGPGEYLLTKGKMEVRGGKDQGGEMVHAVGYGYEACNARHARTYFPEQSEFYMTFLGPLQFVDAEGKTVAVVGWEQAELLWAQQTARR
jgi:acetylacetone-cleaving enzyme